MKRKVGRYFWNEFSTHYSDIFPGVYVPECDADGYYYHTQCHISVGMCWCVDKHGVELPNSRTRGKPNCGEMDIIISQTECYNEINSFYSISSVFKADIVQWQTLFQAKSGMLALLST